MRTSDLISEISDQAKIIYGVRVQELERSRQNGTDTDELQRELFAILFAASNSIYALDGPYLTDPQKDVIADWLIQEGFYFNGTDRLMTEAGYNDPDFDTA